MPRRQIRTVSRSQGPERFVGEEASAHYFAARGAVPGAPRLSPTKLIQG